jgi:hypothetical protein
MTTTTKSDPLKDPNGTVGDLTLWNMIQSAERIVLGFIDEPDDTTFAAHVQYVGDQIKHSSFHIPILERWAALRMVCGFVREKRISQPNRNFAVDDLQLIIGGDPGHETIELCWGENRAGGASIGWEYVPSLRKATVSWETSSAYPNERLVALMCWQ